MGDVVRRKEAGTAIIPGFHIKNRVCIGSLPCFYLFTVSAGNPTMYVFKGTSVMNQLG